MIVYTLHSGVDQRAPIAVAWSDSTSSRPTAEAVARALARALERRYLPVCTPARMLRIATLQGFQDLVRSSARIARGAGAPPDGSREGDAAHDATSAPAFSLDWNHEGLVFGASVVLPEE